jgi:hypothetical protein
MCRELHERTESMDERFRRVKRRVNVHVSENDLCVLTVCDSERRWVGTTGFLDFFGLLLERFVCLFVSFARARLWNGNGIADLRFANALLVSIYNVFVYPGCGDTGG